MNNKNILLTVLILSVVVLFSCQKVQFNDKTYSTNKVNDNTQTKILSFIDKMENKESKDYSEYTIDSAVWYIEAALNYTYCINTNEIRYYKKNIDTMYLSLEQKSDKISFNEVVDAYKSIEKRVKSENQKIVPIDVDIIDVEYEDDELVAYIYIVIEDDADGLDFDENGYYIIDEKWQWGQKLGRCDDDYYLHFRDVTDEINLWIKYQDDPNDNAMVVVPVYWTDVHTTKWYVNDNHVISSILPDDYITLSPAGCNMFFEDATGQLDDEGHYNRCIWTAEALQLAKNTKALRDYVDANLLPEYMSCKEINFHSHFLSIDQGSKYYAYHQMQLVYGLGHDAVF